MSSSPGNGHCKVTWPWTRLGKKGLDKPEFSFVSLRKKGLCTYFMHLLASLPGWQQDRDVKVSGVQRIRQQPKKCHRLLRQGCHTLCLVWEPAPGLLKTSSEGFHFVPSTMAFFYSCQNEKNTKTVTDHLGRLYECPVKPAGFPYCLSSSRRYSALWIFLFGLRQLHGEITGHLLEHFGKGTWFLEVVTRQLSNLLL